MGLKSVRDPDGANNVRLAVRQTLQKAKKPSPNLSKQHREALRTLKNDPDIVILPADKGSATVILDKEAYTEKINSLLTEGSYCQVRRDPTKGVERRIRDKLWSLVQRQELDMTTYRRLRPENCPAPFLYGLPKIHKDEVPLRPIVSTINSPTYALARTLSRVIAPLVGHTDSFVKDSAHFVQILEGLEMSNDPLMVSFDVKSLFTNVPIDEALQVIRIGLEDDDSLSLRTTLSVDSIMELLTLCLKTTYFSYEDSFYQQTDGAAMGSPLSPIVVNIYMECFEQKALKLTNTKPDIWLRYVDDTFVLWPHNRQDLDDFLDHLNSIRPSIQFTMEMEQEGRLPFLDVLVTRDMTNRAFHTEVFRKPTHTDRYLHFDSYHHAHVKTGIIRTLLQCSKRICNSKEALTKEREYIRKVFKNNGYTTGFINRAMSPTQPKSTPKQEYITTVTLPYIKGISEQVRRILGRVNIRAAFRTKTTIRSLLTSVKPAQSPLDKTGVIYSIPCKDCDKVYVGETGRTLNVRQKEHRCHLAYGRTDSSAVATHAVLTLHDIDWENSSVLEHEDNFFKRKVKEALLIHTHDNFNLDDGLAVSPVWTSLL